MTLYTDPLNGSLVINPDGITDGTQEVVFPSPPWGGDLTLYVLWGPADQKGTNIDVPYREGTIPTPKRKTETTRDVQFTLSGECDVDGTPSESGRVMLEQHVDFLTANVGDPPPAGETRTALLIMPSGAEREAEVQSQLLLGEQIDYVIKATLRLIVPEWFVVAVGS